MASNKVARADEECSSIAEIACGTDGFSTLCAAVQAAGLAGPLSTDRFTVFAPTDEAFAKLPPGTVEALLGDIPALTNILLYHAASGCKLYSNNLRCNSPVKMANGQQSTTVCGRLGQKFQKGNGNSDSALPEITAANIEACNGIIHVISEVMLP